MWGQGQGQQPNQWGNNQQQPNQWTNNQQQPNQWSNNQQQPNQWGNSQNQGVNNQWANQGNQPNQWGNQGNQGFQPNQQQQNQWGNQGNQGFQPNQNQWGNQQGLHNIPNPFIKPNQNWGNNGYNHQPNWINPNNFIVPPIMFVPNCNKCHGQGIMHKKGMNIPCRKCYRKNGICPRCYGSGIKYINKKPCKCNKGAFFKNQGHGHSHGHGHGHGKHRSSSSSSGSF